MVPWVFTKCNTQFRPSSRKVLISSLGLNSGYVDMAFRSFHPVDDYCRIGLRKGTQTCKVFLYIDPVVH